MQKITRDLQHLIELHTAAQVAVWLGYRDARAIYQWVQRDKIPKARVLLVKRLVEERLK